MSTLDFFRLIAYQSAITRYCMVAGYVWVIYDWLITLDQEIDLVWRRSGAWKSKVLYAFIRYIGLALLTYDLVVMLGTWSPLFCRVYFFLLGGIGLALLFAVEGTLQLRIYVMYHSSRRILLVNGVIFVLEMACMTWMFLIDTIRFKPIETPYGLKGCFAATNEVRYSKAMWWLCLAFETYLSLFVFRVAISHIRAYGAGSHILYILIRDSLVWFVLLALCLLWNAVAWSAAPVGLSTTGIPALHASATIGGCRMLLNLRAAYFESLEPRDIDATAISELITGGTVGRFRAFWTSTSGKRNTVGNQTLDEDHDVIDRNRHSAGARSWISRNNHVLRRSSPVPPPLSFAVPQDNGNQMSARTQTPGSVDIELQDLSHQLAQPDSLSDPAVPRGRPDGPSRFSSRRSGVPNGPPSPIPPSWNW